MRKQSPIKVQQKKLIHKPSHMVEVGPHAGHHEENLRHSLLHIHGLGGLEEMVEDQGIYDRVTAADIVLFIRSASQTGTAELSRSARKKISEIRLGE